ncbi:DNA-binding protein [Microbulbifer pacificus]|uniref:DNA-binding protein n=1 Tax=Microbulbifer pacificus TaxID=407164 RepID=A0AAU0MYP8_9GAMM|nr:DNA-binding protein [Microbulbifer pacificus]WOX05633.1 DNA-binding protein [Microbulbifer pacificus]
MARIGVSYFDIAQAAETIRQRGDEPTVDRVREELGTGSKSTIAPLLKRWKSETGNTQHDATGLPQDLVDALKALHLRVQEDADRKVDAVREEATATVEQVRAELAQLRAVLAERTGNLRELEQKLQDSEQESRSRKLALDEVQAALVKSEYQREEGSARITELRANLDELKQENRTVREHFEFFQQRIADDRQQERDQFRQANAQLNSQIASLNEQLTFAGQRLAEREQKIEEQGALHAQQTAELQKTQQALAANRAEYDTLLQSFTRQQAQLSAQLEEAGGMRDKIATLSSSNAALVRETELQRETGHKLEREIMQQREVLTALNTAHQQVLQQKAELQGQLTQLERKVLAPAPVA